MEQAGPAEQADVTQRREVSHEICFVCGAPGVVSGRRPGTYVSGGDDRGLYGVVDQKPAPSVCEAHQAALNDRSAAPRWCSACKGWRAVSPCQRCGTPLD